MSSKKQGEGSTMPPPPTTLLKGPTFQWDRGPVRHLWSVSSPAPPSTYFRLGDSVQSDIEALNAAQNNAIKGKVTILHAPFLCGFADWESGVLASARLDKCGEVTDAYKRGETYDGEEEYQPYSFTVEDALAREGIWELDVPNERPVGTISQLKHLWPREQMIAAHCGTKITRAQFWTNIRFGIGGTCTRTIPYATVHRVIYGTQYVFWNESDWISDTPSSPVIKLRASPPLKGKPGSPKHKKSISLEIPRGRERKYVDLCEHMANYTYAQMKGWRCAVLNKGDAIVVPPTCPIGIFSATDCSTTYHTYALTSHLPLIEATFNALKDVSLNPMDIRPTLAAWMESRTPEQLFQDSGTMNSESKRSLFRLLAYEADTEADRFVNSDATYYWYEDKKSSRYLKDNSVLDNTKSLSPNRERVMIRDVSKVKLDPETREKLFGLVPLPLRMGHGWRFFGWGDAEFSGVKVPTVSPEELREVPEMLKETLELAASPQARSLWTSKTKMDLRLMARM